MTSLADEPNTDASTSNPRSLRTKTIRVKDFTEVFEKIPESAVIHKRRQNSDRQVVRTVVNELCGDHPFAGILNSGQAVALKIFSTDPREEMTLRRELKTHLKCSRAQHPNILPAYTIVVKTSTQVAMVVEYMHGKTLKQGKVKSTRAECVRSALHVARGLAEVHRVGYVHCDLKRSNVLYTSASMEGERVAKIIDFGSALRQGIAVQKRADAVNGFSSLYSPPEIYLQPNESVGYFRICPSLDLWSLGVFLMRLFEKSLWVYPKLSDPKYQDYIEYLEKLERENHPYTAFPVSSTRIPLGVRQLVARLLHPDPQRRCTIEFAISALETLNDEEAKLAEEEEKNATSNTLSAEAIAGQSSKFNRTRIGSQDYETFQNN